MKYEPHDYQKYATDFIVNNPVAAVFLDLGLGKTAITLDAIHTLMKDTFEVNRVLIVAPLRVAKYTWPSEIRKWDNFNDLTYSVATGTEAERIAALRRKTDIHIINRENVQWMIEKSGLPFRYDMIVIDELSSFKSYQAKRFRALMKVRPMVSRIVGLTGTPSSNGLMDLWAEFKLLDMGQRLGRFITNYRANYFVPDKRNGAVVFSYKPRHFAEEAIYEKIGDITISMRAEDHLQMPELLMNEVKVELSEEEAETYDTMRKDMVVALGDKEIDALNAAALSNKLSQMASGAVYDSNHVVHHIHNRKLDCLEDLIEAANGKPVLIAFWFQHDRARIEERLQKLKIKYEVLGSDESFDRWNAGELPVALIHPANCGHGINLQSGGSTLIWFSLTWSLELYQQCNGRIFRQGQKDTVVIHHIITQGTIDERVMQALKNKEKSQDALIDAVKANLEVRL